ncbi:efflux transporter outer membrane subunit [Pseudomonas syringae pv. tagetis]|uniref:Efflux transporter outer membrane subunit n=1 Tax=Pseudomonas syringae pv. tagetis TaxID=129140 RepID=A0ABW7NLA9_9PSED|nr:efflux transporter outer membrane subunit [Pseudomonas syringae group genomosp. 7]UNB71259.1 efflux transporter outer membrane subunit [Pseudomonas syringae pv. tagetis]
MSVFAAIALLTLSACSLQPDYVKPALSGPARWSVESDRVAVSAPAATENWWRSLGDEAMNALIEAAFTDNPTLLQAVTRIDEARATLGVSKAARMPAIGIDASATREQSRNTSPVSSSTTALSSSASAGPTFSWEIDLFGRVRESVEASRSLLDARTADAASTRLTLATDVADNVLILRACENSRRVLNEDIASREKTLELTRLRLRSGFAAAADEARILSGLATSRTNLADQQEQCARQVNALVALTGESPEKIRNLIGIASPVGNSDPVFMPQAPAAAPVMPAIVLAQHPDLISAEREVAAAWADIAVARADRLPKIDLTAALTGQWIRAGGSSLDFNTWSLGPGLTGTLFDGGAGAANVSVAEARYRRAVATLQSTLRTTVQDVENAIAAQASAKSRVASTSDGVIAARMTLKASDDQWKVGAVSLFELEDSRRQFASAQDAEISARRDQAQAWISLIKATGGAIALITDTRSHE